LQEDSATAAAKWIFVLLESKALLGENAI